jgi:hypothetical protein
MTVASYVSFYPSHQAIVLPNFDIAPGDGDGDQLGNTDGLLVGRSAAIIP